VVQFRALRVHRTNLGPNRRWAHRGPTLIRSTIFSKNDTSGVVSLERVVRSVWNFQPMVTDNLIIKSSSGCTSARSSWCRSKLSRKSSNGKHRDLVGGVPVVRLVQKKMPRRSTKKKLIFFFGPILVVKTKVWLWHIWLWCYDSSFRSWAYVHQKLDAENTLFWPPIKRHQTAWTCTPNSPPTIPNQARTCDASYRLKYPLPKVRLGKHGFGKFLTIKRQSKVVVWCNLRCLSFPRIKRQAKVTIYGFEVRIFCSTSARMSSRSHKSFGNHALKPMRLDCRLILRNDKILIFGRNRGVGANLLPKVCTSHTRRCVYWWETL